MGTRTGAGHPGGVTQRFGYHVTDIDNHEGGILAQPTGLQRDMRSSTLILFQVATGKLRVSAARLDQRVGERVYTLSRAKCGEL